MATIRQYPKRQAMRKAVLFLLFLFFPVVMNFISPYVIIDGTLQGIISGSFIMFGVMFVLSLVFGRLWCAWVCPGAGMEEACFMVNDKPARGGKLNWIKWGIWFVWIGVIAFAAISAGGYRKVDFLHLTETGISVDEPFKYITYYMVLIPIFLLSIFAGRRAFCHYGCWMAPFMIIGRKIRNALNTPALRLVAEKDRCINCKKCTQGCPMSLDVNGMVQAGSMENSECILCGNCIDTCPKNVIRYSFSRGK